MCFFLLEYVSGKSFSLYDKTLSGFQISVKMFETSAGYQPLSGFHKNLTLVSLRSLSNELLPQNQVKTALQK